MTETQLPDWLKPGAEVMIWTNNPTRGAMIVISSRVLKVWKKTFSVEHHTDKFEIRTMRSRTGSAWDPGYCCAPADSDQAREILEKARQERLTRTARTAVARWDAMPTRKNRLAAIAALRAVETDHPA